MAWCKILGMSVVVFTEPQNNISDMCNVYFTGMYVLLHDVFVFFSDGFCNLYLDGWTFIRNTR